MTLFRNSPTEPTAPKTPIILANHRANLLLWMLCCLLAALVFLTYAGSSVMVGQGDVIMPLDDAYIHFQYARQLASGEPYVYNPGDSPTSGATSFIYPYVLATGYVLGFQGLTLGLWALGIGALALLASMWLVILTVSAVDDELPIWFAGGIGLAFGLNGAISWHFMSGMETGLVITFSLATLYLFITRRFYGFVVVTSLLALARPEASVMALIAVSLFVVRAYFAGELRRHFIWLIFPIVSVGVQPIVNMLLTGSLSSTGNQAKSILSVVPFYWDAVIRRFFEQFARIWAELSTGTDGVYLPVIIAPLAFIGWLVMSSRRETRYAGILILLWLLMLTAAIATLDTAFWHFKRYQMPMMALLFPLAGWGVWWLIGLFRQESQGRLATLLTVFTPVLLVLMMLPSFAEFQRLYRVNLNNIMAQPLPMARWLAENTPEDAVIAVHDVGMMRYVGDRTTLDMVGLTTPAAADYWRNGPGAVAEFLLNHNPVPDYVAAYTTARGLNYLEATGLYGELLAGFSAEYDPADNVALGAEFQGIYRVDVPERTEFQPLQGNLWRIFNQRAPIGPPFVVDTVNVADLASEQAHDYRWSDVNEAVGFPTEAYQFDYADCVVDTADACSVIDGGRRINGEESFVLALDPELGGALLVTRLHPAFSGTFDVYVDDQFIARRWIPEMAGRWLEVATVIPEEMVMATTQVRIVPQMANENGFYMPYTHWALQGITQGDLYRAWMEDTPLATYQDGEMALMRLDQDVRDGALTLNLLWQTDGSAEGDYKVFVHIYDDINAEPVAQWDGYTNGTLPPGNWLAGVITDTIMVDLGNVPAGTYQVAIGFYEATTFDRLLLGAIGMNDSVVDEAGRRLFIGEITLP